MTGTPRLLAASACSFSLGFAERGGVQLQGVMRVGLLLLDTPSQSDAYRAACCYLILHRNPTPIVLLTKTFDGAVCHGYWMHPCPAGLGA